MTEALTAYAQTGAASGPAFPWVFAQRLNREIGCALSPWEVEQLDEATVIEGLLFIGHKPVLLADSIQTIERAKENYRRQIYGRGKVQH